MDHDLQYIQSLRDRAIGFEMQAFYDAWIQKIYDARYRSFLLRDVELGGYR